jgi:hypothetical protein
VTSQVIRVSAAPRISWLSMACQWLGGLQLSDTLEVTQKAAVEANPQTQLLRYYVCVSLYRDSETRHPPRPLAAPWPHIHPPPPGRLLRVFNAKADMRFHISLPFFDLTTCTRDPARATPISVEAGGVVLVEGLMSLRDPRIRAVADLRVFVDCDEDIRFMRRLARDTNTDTHTGGRGCRATSVYRAWATAVRPSHHKYVEPSRRFADIVVPSTMVHAVPKHLRVVIEPPPDSTGPGPLLRAVSDHEDQVGKADIDQGELEMWPALHLLHAFISTKWTGMRADQGK